MGLIDVNEVPVVGSKCDAMVERRIGQAHIAFAVEPNAVQLRFHVVIAIACHVIEKPGALVDLHQIGHFE